MCGEDTCCGMQLRTATIVYSVLFLILCFAGIGYAVYGLLEPKIEYYRGEPIVDLATESVHAFFLLILLVGACAERRGCVMTYYIFGILVSIAGTAFAIYSFTQGAYLVGGVVLAVVLIKTVILHLLIHRTIQSF